MYIAEPAEPRYRERADTAVSTPLPLRLLAAIAIDQAGVADFAALAEPRPGERTAARLYVGSTHDVWLIRWAPGSGTEMHDHGGSAGALYVAAGALVEYAPTPARGGEARPRSLATSEHRVMPAAHVHQVVNDSDLPAASVHVYAPPLTTMGHYERANGSGLRVTQREVVDLGTFGSHYGPND